MHFFVAFFKSGIVWSSILSLFSKVQLCERTFQKCNCAIPLFKSALVQLHFLSLFSKVGLCDLNFLLHFSIVQKKSDHMIALLKRANVRRCAKQCKFPKSFFLLFKKSNHTFSKHIQKFTIFCTFPHICSFQRCHCAIALFANLFKSGIEQLHFFVALCKSGIVQSHIFLLFSKVQLCDHTFQKWDCEIALFKSATKRVITQLLFWKEQMSINVRITVNFQITLLHFVSRYFSEYLTTVVWLCRKLAYFVGVFLFDSMSFKVHWAPKFCW